MKNRLVNLFGISSVTLLWTAVFVVAITALIALTTNTATAALSRIAYWQLDETSGTTFADSESGSHDASCTNCPAPTTGVVNGAQGFDGVDDAIDVPADSAFDWTGGDIFSVELWVQADDANVCSGSAEAFIGRGVSGSGQWSLGCTASGTVQFDLADDNGNSVSLQSTKSITDTAWHHVAATYDGSSDAITLYVDGTDVQTATQAFTGNFAPTTADLNIGHVDGGAHFSGVLDEIAVYNGLLSATEVGSHYFLARSYTNTCAGDIRIMPLGDSITQGASSGESDLTKQIGYRYDLWHLLADDDYPIDFVGGLQHGEYYQSIDGFDPDHEGHPGYRDSDIENFLSGYLSSNPADVILLHIGTNALDTDPGDVEDILTIIDQFDENITVVLARIINQDPTNPTVTTFNDNVEAMANNRIANGDKIIIVDMEDGAGIVYDAQPTGDMWDDLHPYETGYAKMATVWYDALVTFLPTCLTAPTITSSPVTTAVSGEPYSYTVTATGNPDPTFSLVSPPTGMTINANSGLIQWTPTITGTESITVTATNDVGTGTQSFILNVIDPVPPSITSTAVTLAIENKPYSYDVDADGLPAPLYSLSQHPPGMIVDENTGVISWTPDSTGTYTATVEADNKAGNDSQPFTIDVEPAPVCPADTIAYWPLETLVSGTVAYDHVSTHDGTCSGADCPTITTGVIGNAADFDGSDDGLVVVDDTTLNWQNGDSFSIELWVNTSQISADNTVLIGKYGPDGTWWLGFNKDGQATFNLRDTATKSLEISGSSSINDGAWHHIVAMHDGAASENRLYVDGVEEAAQPRDYTGDFSNGNPVTIGYYDTSNGFYFDGLIDDVNLYSRTLDPNEISSHFQNRNYCGSAVSPIIITDPVTEGITGTGYTYDVDATGVPTPTYTLTEFPSGMIISETTGLIEWTPTSSGTYPVTVVADNGEGTDEQSFTLIVANPTAPSITSTPVIEGNVGQPYNYNVTADGVPSPTYELTTSPPDMTIVTTTGRIEWMPTTKGIYTVTVTASNSEGSDEQTFTIDVASAPICPAQMSAYWKLDAVISSTFTDTLGTHDASCTGGNCPTLETGRVEMAAGFDGLNDGLIIPDHDDFDWQNGDSFAIELWVNAAQSCNETRVFVGKYDPNGSWWVGCNDSGKATFSLRDSNGTSPPDISSTTSIDDGSWYHIVAMRDGTTGESQLYVNGAQEASVAQSYTGNFANDQPVTMGYYDNNYRFGGLLDEVGIYNRTLSSAEILQHYNDGLTEVGYCEAAVAPEFTSTAVTTATVSQLYSYDANATGVPTPTYALTGTPPNGMAIDNVTGEITWTPTDGGEYSVSVKATNSEGEDTQTFTITVAEPPAVTSTAPTEAIVGELYTYNVNATGYPAPTYTLTANPPGMSINETTGVITWTPGSTTTANVTVRASSSSGETTQTFSITVLPAGESPVITSPSDVIRTKINEPFSYTVQASGVPEPTFSLTDTPPTGMDIDDITGEITWTPTETGIFSVTVRATNSVDSTEETFTIEVSGYSIFLPMITAAP